MANNVKRSHHAAHHALLRMPMLFKIILLAASCTLSFSNAYAVDEDNCLFCHGYRGLSYINEQGAFKLLYVTEDLYVNSPHGSLRCTDCHTTINKYPHDDSVKVDCLSVCHMNEPSSGLPFSHKSVGEALRNSIHSKYDSEGRLKKHHDDLPDCVTCHMDPLYRPLAFLKHEIPGMQEKTVQRCSRCHENREFMEKFYNHFTCRMQKLRPPIEIVELCAKCHGDTDMMNRHDLPNVMKSYMETYHGKALYFGDELAADCNDCHVLPGESIHAVKSMDNPDSATYHENIYKTCSDIDCHPKAKLNLTGYKAHVVISPTSNPVEFYFASFFVLLTIGSFVPLMLFTVLDMARHVFPHFSFSKLIRKKKHAKN